MSTTKRKWTGGEWKLDVETGGIFRANGSIAQVRRRDASVGSRERDVEAQANAHLIAAGPQLYEALEQTSELLDRAIRALDNDVFVSLTASIEKQMTDNQAALAAALGEGE